MVYLENTEAAERISQNILSTLKYEKKKQVDDGVIYDALNTEELRDMAWSLHNFILRDAKTEHYVFPEYTSTKQNTLSVFAKDGLIYDFYAFYGDKCGGSEWRETYELNVLCKETGLDVNILSSITFSR